MRASLLLSNTVERGWLLSWTSQGYIFPFITRRESGWRPRNHGKIIQEIHHVPHAKKDPLHLPQTPDSIGFSESFSLTSAGAFDARCLHVGNLPPSVRNPDLAKLFKRWGLITIARVVVD